MLIPRTRESGRAGHTLVEVTIAVALLGLILGSIGLVANTGSQLFATSVARNDVESRARRALSRIQSELLSADHSSLDGLAQSPVWADRLIFEQVSAISERDGEPEWITSLIEFRYEDGEPDDGVDNDGDGLIDEGVVVLVRDWNGPAEQEVVLCRGVAELQAGEDLDGADNKVIFIESDDDGSSSKVRRIKIVTHDD